MGWAGFLGYNTAGYGPDQLSTFIILIEPVVRNMRTTVNKHVEQYESLYTTFSICYEIVVDYYFCWSSGYNTGLSLSFSYIFSSYKYERNDDHPEQHCKCSIVFLHFLVLPMALFGFFLNVCQSVSHKCRKTQHNQINPCIYTATLNFVIVLVLHALSCPIYAQLRVGFDSLVWTYHLHIGFQVTRIHLPERCLPTGTTNHSISIKGPRTATINISTTSFMQLQYPK